VADTAGSSSKEAHEQEPEEPETVFYSHPVSPECPPLSPVLATEDPINVEEEEPDDPTESSEHGEVLQVCFKHYLFFFINL